MFHQHIDPWRVSEVELCNAIKGCHGNTAAGSRNWLPVWVFPVFGFSLLVDSVFSLVCALVSFLLTTLTKHYITVSYSNITVQCVTLPCIQLHLAALCFMQHQQQTHAILI